ncbi:MAG: hypothetical protein Q8M40_07635 [Legionella sp.]|nr:hypothetical protein [Legionella sp.]
MTFEFKEFESLKKTFIDSWDVISRNELINKANIEVEFKFIHATINHVEQKIKHLAKDSPEYIENMEIMYGAVQLVKKHFDLQKEAKVRVNENIFKCLNDTLGITQEKKPAPQELLNWQRKLNQFLNCSFVENKPFKGFKDQHTYSHIDKNKLIIFFNLNYVMQEELFKKMELSKDETFEYLSSFQSKEAPKGFTKNFQSFEDLEKTLNDLIAEIIGSKNKLYWFELDRKEELGLIINFINILKNPPKINKGTESKTSMFESDKIVILLGILYLIRAKINVQYSKDVLNKESTKTFGVIGGSELHRRINFLLGSEEFEEIDYYISRAKSFLDYLLINPGKNGANDTIKLDNNLFSHIVKSFTELKPVKSIEPEPVDSGELKPVKVDYDKLITFIYTIMSLCNKITTKTRDTALKNSILIKKQITETESAKFTEGNNTNSEDASEIKNNHLPKTIYHTPANSDDEPKSEEAYTSAFNV